MSILKTLPYNTDIHALCGIYEADGRERGTSQQASSINSIQDSTGFGAWPCPCWYI